MKTCKKCGETKALTEFSPLKTGKYGVAGRCKPCKNIEKKEWRLKNPEAFREYYAINREVLRQKKQEKRKDPIQKAKDKALKDKWIAAMGLEAYTAWRKKLRIKYKDKITAYNKETNLKYPDCEVRAEIRSRCKVAKLTNEQIPHELIEVYRLLRFINRKIKHENM